MIAKLWGAYFKGEGITPHQPIRSWDLYYSHRKAVQRTLKSHLQNLGEEAIWDLMLVAENQVHAMFYGLPRVCSLTPFFFNLGIFLCGPFKKYLFNLLQYCFCFMLWVFVSKAWGISLTRDQIHTPCTVRQSLNHWTSRKSLLLNFWCAHEMKMQSLISRSEGELEILYF